MKIDPKIVYDDDKGKKIGIVLKKNDFDKLIEYLEDAIDIEYVKKRANEKGRHYTHEEVMSELFGV